MAKLSSITVKLKLPQFVELEGSWVPNDDERHAAWDLYVELVTRLGAYKVAGENGVFRESLTSLHELFPVTRSVLREYGPGIANVKRGRQITLGHIAIIVLDQVLRPFLTRWHPLLTDYETSRKHEVSIVDHERDWEHAREFQSELDRTYESLLQYAGLLAEAAKVANLHKYDSSNAD